MSQKHKSKKEKQQTLREKFDQLHPTSPTVYFTNASNNSNEKKAEIYTLHCQQMEFNIECFVQTASMNMVGQWKNQTSDYMNCLFIIPMRGRITDCFIHIGIERVHSVGLIEKTASNIVYGKMQDMVKEEKKEENKYEDRAEWNLIEDLFSSQIDGYFRIPFDNVKPDQNIRIDLYYIESLKIVSNAFYLSIPITLSRTTISSSKKWSDVITKINTTIYHPANVDITIVSKSHRLEMVNNNNCIQITANALKNISDDNNHNIGIYGKDYELQYYFVTETFSASLIIDDEKNKENHDHYVLISPPQGLQSNNYAFDRNICFLVDRSTRSSLVWIDIVHAIEHCLDRMNETDRFSIILFDTQYMSWATQSQSTQPLQLHYCTSDKKKPAIKWMTVYKPDPNKLDSKLEQPLYETLKLLKQSTSNTIGSYCVIIGSSHYQNEKDIINKMINLKSNYDSNGVISQRIYGVSIGNGINKYFLNYLSLISRGKTISLNNPKTVYDELISFFNEFRLPMLCDIKLNVEFMNRNVSFQSDQMLHPYPITDLYYNHPMMLQLTVPNAIEYKIKQITISGSFANKDMEIPAIIDDHKYKFPMDIILAILHLNYLHSNIWYLSDGLNENSNTALLKFKANKISDNTGLASPTRLLQCIQETLEQSSTDEKKMDLNELKLPPRTGRGARRKNKKMGKKNKAAAIGTAAAVGTVAVVTVLNPFGGGDGIFGDTGNAFSQLTGGDCECCGECGPCGEGDCQGGCGGSCQQMCVVM